MNCLTGHDSTLEVSDADLKGATELRFSDKLDDLKAAQIYIVTVPTPIDDNNSPDLTPLRKSSEMLAKVISKGDTVIFESTVLCLARRKRFVSR